jgi:hypothetical protein
MIGVFMKKTILVVLSLCTLFFGIIGSIQADSNQSNPPVKERPPLGDDGPGNGDDDGKRK